MTTNPQPGTTGFAGTLAPDGSVGQPYYGIPVDVHGGDGKGKGNGNNDTFVPPDLNSLLKALLGGGGGGAKKSNDKPQMDALTRMLGSGGFKKALNTKLANINLDYKQTDADILKSYGERAGQLDLSRKDNQKAEADASFANLANRARERSSTLEQTALQGAGETDTLKSQLMALRNYSANQQDINRSFYDTQRSVNSSITGLNADTRTARLNALQQRNKAKEESYTNYYNQKADAYTQQGNLSANPNSNQFGKNKGAFNNAASMTGKAWKDPGAPASITNWKGTVKATEEHLNNSKLGTAVTNLAEKKPEGATLRKW
jgi:hypothetical protein